MNCLELLIADHNRVRGLFKRFKDAEETNDKATMEEVVGKIVDELTIHTTIEEEIFYPAIKGETEDIKDVVVEGIEEHHVAKTLIDELPTVEAGSDEWVAKVKVLIESVEHHAEEEEKEMFPPVRSHTAKTMLDDLGEQLAARKVELGAPPMEMALELSTDELKELASKQEIPGRSKMDRDELAATVDPRG
jgi:hemerythrin superfamily protein